MILALLREVEDIFRNNDGYERKEYLLEISVKW